MPEPGRTSTSVGIRLSIMMFLQYAIWGAWLPLLYPFLSSHRAFTDAQIGDMFAVGAVGAIVAPFIAGQIADRYFSTEKFLALSHVLGGVLVWQLARLESYWAFLLFSLAYSLIYAPTLSLTNSLAFHHLADRDRDFGRIRVWGTVGWIVVGLSIGQWLLHTKTITPEQAVQRMAQAEFATAEQRAEVAGRADAVAAAGRAAALLDALQRMERAGAEGLDAIAGELARGRVIAPAVLERYVYAGQVAGMSDAFRLSALLGVLMGAFCLVLPHTPPSPGRRANASLEAMTEVKRQPLLTLFLLAVPISCIHQFYFVHTAGFLGSFQSQTASAINDLFGVGGGGLMTIGQMSEILVLAIIPLVAKKVSRKSLLGLGIVAYAVRMALFAYVDAIAGATGIPAVAILMTGVAMHGLCFGCFIFVAFMIVDEETTGDVRASAQSLFNLVIVGIGIIVGSKIATWVAQWAKGTEGIMDYGQLFSVPLWASVACLVFLLLLYPGGRRPAAPG